MKIMITGGMGFIGSHLCEQLLIEKHDLVVSYKEFFKKMAKVIDSLSNSVHAYSQILSLPLYPSISKKQQDVVINNIKKYKA